MSFHPIRRDNPQSANPANAPASPASIDKEVQDKEVQAVAQRGTQPIATNIKEFEATLFLDPKAVKSGSGISIYLERVSKLGWWNLTRFAFPPIVLIDIAYLIYCSVVPSSRFIPAETKAEFRAGLSSQLTGQKDWLHVIQLSKDLFNQGDISDSLTKALHIGHALSNPVEAKHLIDMGLTENQAVVVPCGFFDGQEFIPTLVSIQKNETTLIVQEFLVDHRYGTDGKTDPVRTWEMEGIKLQAFVDGLSELIKPQKERADYYTLEQKKLLQARTPGDVEKKEPTFIQSGIGELLQGMGRLQAEAVKRPLRSSSKDPFKLIYTWVEDQHKELTLKDKVLFMAQAHARMAQLVLKYSKHLSMKELALLQTQLSKRLTQLEKLAKKHKVLEVEEYINKVKSVKIEKATIGFFEASTKRHLILRYENERIEALSATPPAHYPEIKGIGPKKVQTEKPTVQKASLDKTTLEALNNLKLDDPKEFINGLHSLLEIGEKLLNDKKYREATLLANGLLSAIPSPMDPFWKSCEGLSREDLDRLSELITQASKQLFEARMHLSPTHLWNDESLNLMNARCIVLKILDIKAQQIIAKVDNAKLNEDKFKDYQKEEGNFGIIEVWLKDRTIDKEEAKILISNKFRDEKSTIEKWMSDPYLYFNEQVNLKKFQDIKTFFIESKSKFTTPLEKFDRAFQFGTEEDGFASLITELTRSLGADEQSKIKTYEAISLEDPGLLPPQLIELRQLQVYSNCLMHPEYSLYLGFQNITEAGMWMLGIAAEAKKETDNREQLIEKIIELQRRVLDLKLQKMGRLELTVSKMIVGGEKNVVKIRSQEEILEYHPEGLDGLAHYIQIDEDVNRANCGYLPQGMGRAAISAENDWEDAIQPWTRYSDRGAFIRALKETNPTLRDQDKVLLYQIQLGDQTKKCISAHNVFNAICADPKILNSEIARHRISQVLLRPGVLEDLRGKNPDYYKRIINTLKNLPVENLDAKAFLYRIIQCMDVKGEELDLTRFKEKILVNEGSKEIALLYLQSSFKEPTDEDLKALFMAWQILSAFPPASADEFSIRQHVQLHLIPTLFKNEDQIQRLCHALTGSTLPFERIENSYTYSDGDTEIDFFQGALGNERNKKKPMIPLPEEVRSDEQFLKIFGDAVPKLVEAESLGSSKMRYRFGNGDREFAILYDRQAEKIQYSQFIDGKEWIYRRIKTIDDTHMALAIKNNGLWQNESGSEALLLIGTANDWRTNASLSQRQLNVSLNNQRQIKEIRTVDGKLVIHDPDSALLKSLGMANPSHMILFKDSRSNRLGGFKIIGTELSFIRDKNGNFVSEKDRSWSIRMRETSGLVEQFGESYQRFMIPLIKGKENEYQIIPYAIGSKALGRKGYAVDYIQPADQSLPILKMTGIPGQERGSHATFLYLSYQAAARGELQQANYWLDKANLLDKANKANYIKGEEDFLKDQMGQLLQQIPVNSDAQAAYLLKARLTLSRILREQYHQLTMTPDSVMSRQKEIESLVSLYERPHTIDHLTPEDKNEFQLIKKECIASILQIGPEVAKKTETSRKLPDEIPDAFYTHLIFWMDTPRSGMTMEKLRQEGLTPSPEHLLKHFWDYWSLVESEQLTADGLAPLFAKPIITTNPELRQAIQVARSLLLANAQAIAISLLPENAQATPPRTPRPCPDIKQINKSKGLMKKLPNYEKWIGKYGAVLDLNLQHIDRIHFEEIKKEIVTTFGGLKTEEPLLVSETIPTITADEFMQKIQAATGLSEDEKEIYLNGTFPKSASERRFLEKLIEGGVPVVATRYSTVLDSKLDDLETKFRTAQAIVESFQPSAPSIGLFKDYETHFSTPIIEPPRITEFDTAGSDQERTYLSALNDAIEKTTTTETISIPKVEPFKKAIVEEFKKNRQDAQKLRKELLSVRPKNEEYLRLTRLFEETKARIDQGDRTVGLFGLAKDLQLRKYEAEEVLLASLFEEYRNGTSTKDVEKISELLILETRLQQLEKVLNLIPHLEKKESRTAKDIQTILNDSRKDRYKLNGTEFIQAKEREFLVFEWTNGIILRKEQIEKIDALLDDPNALEVFRMGLGKTSAVFPLLARLQTLQNKFPVIYFPEGLLEQSRDTMDKRAYIFSFSKNSPSEPLQLKELYATLLEIATTNRYVMSSIESRCFLKNKMIELNNSLVPLAEKGNAAKEMQLIQEQLYWLTKIERLLEPQEGRVGKQTVSLADEPDEVFHITHERNYAIDQPEVIDFNVYETGKKIFEELGNHRKYGTEAVLALSEDEAKARMRALADDRDIIRELAAKVCGPEYVDYVIDKKKSPVSDVSNQVKLYRHWFTQTLPILFKEIYGFDCRIEEGGHLVLPLDRGSTLRDTTYGDECELAGHQFFAYLYHQPSPKALEQMKDQLKGFEELIDGKTPLTPSQWKKIQGAYIEVLFRKAKIVQINREQIICNAQDGVNQTPVAAASGTMNPRALPSTFKKPADDKTLAVSAETLLKMGGRAFLDKQVHVYSSLEDEMKKIALNPKYKAIINQGETLGDKTTLDLIAKLRVDSDRQFIFIHPTLRKPYIWFPNALTPRPFDKVADRGKIDEEKVLYYFGPADSRGTDFKIPKGMAALFTGPGTLMPDFEQAIWRMRQLGEGQTIELYSQVEQTNQELVISIAKQTVKKNLELNAKAALDQPKAIVRKTLRQLLYVDDPKGDPKKQAELFKRIKEIFPGYFIQKSTILETLEQEYMGSKDIKTKDKLLKAYDAEIEKLGKIKDVNEKFVQKAIDELTTRRTQIEKNWKTEFAPYLPDTMEEVTSTTAGIRQETQQQQQQQAQQQQQQVQQQSLKLSPDRLNVKEPAMQPLNLNDVFDYQNKDSTKLFLATSAPPLFRPIATDFCVGCSQYFLNLYKTAHAAGDPKMVYLFLHAGPDNKSVVTLGTSLDLAHLYVNLIPEDPNDPKTKDLETPLGVYQVSGDQLILVAVNDILKSRDGSTAHLPGLHLRVAQAKLALGYEHFSEDEKTELKRWYKSLSQEEKTPFIQWLKEQLIPEKVIAVLTS